MRQLTFSGFLKDYVQSLSLTNTLSLKTLVAEAYDSNPRLREPLLLYALFTGKSNYLLRFVSDFSHECDYSTVLTSFDKTSMLDALQSQSALLPEGYKKVWRSYISRKNRPQTDCDTKTLMRQKVLSLQEESGVSNYRIYKSLGLNPGNLNAWLKHGDNTKVSLDTARKVLQFTKNAVTTS